MRKRLLNACGQVFLGALDLGPSADILHQTSSPISGKERYPALVECINRVIETARADLAILAETMPLRYFFSNWAVVKAGACQLAARLQIACVV